MRLKEIFQIDQSQNIIALNGYYQPGVIQELFRLFNSSISNKWININGNDYLHIEKIVAALIKSDEETFQYLAVSSINNYSSLASALESKSDIKNQYIITVDMFECDNNVIVQLLSSIRDIAFSSVIKKRFKIILWGNWSSNNARDELKKLGVSYPFVKNRSELYLSQYHFEMSDYELIKKSYPFVGYNLLSIILDYSRGEVFSTLFILMNSHIMDNTIELTEEYFTEIARSYYHYYKKSFPNMYELKNILQNRLSINSLILDSEVNEDLLSRSNLFNIKLKTGDRIIFRPYNYLAEYILYQLCIVDECYSPTSPIIQKSKDIFIEILEIELQIKQCIRIINNYLSNRIVSKIPIIIRSYPNGINIVDGLDIFLKQMEKDKKYWEDENPPQDFLSVLSFGQTKLLLDGLDTTYFVQDTFEINANSGLYKLNQGKVLQESLKITVNKDEYLGFHRIQKENKFLLRKYIPENKEEDYLISREDIYNIKSNPLLIRMLEDKMVPIIGIFKNYKIARNNLEQLLEYRNAFAHLKTLSQDATKKYEIIKKELFKNLSLR